MSGTSGVGSKPAEPMTVKEVTQDIGKKIVANVANETVKAALAKATQSSDSEKG